MMNRFFFVLLALALMLAVGEAVERDSYVPRIEQGTAVEGGSPGDVVACGGVTGDGGMPGAARAVDLGTIDRSAWAGALGGVVERMVGSGHKLDGDDIVHVSRQVVAGIRYRVQVRADGRFWELDFVQPPCDCKVERVMFHHCKPSPGVVRDASNGAGGFLGWPGWP